MSKSRKNRPGPAELLDSIPVMVSNYLPDGTIVFVNRTFCEYWGTTPEKMVGEKIGDFLPAETWEKTRRNLELLTVTKPQRTHDFNFPGRNGVNRWQRWTDKAVFDENGEPLAYYSTGFDITESNRFGSKLIRINKLNFFRDKINELQTGVWDDYRLIMDICSRAVKYGGFGMSSARVWEEGNGYVHCHAFENDPVVHVHTEDSQLDCSFLASLGHETAPRINNDLSANTCEPLRCVFGKENLFNSFAAFPLILPGGKNGLIVFFSQHKDYFLDRDELSLLTRITGDIRHLMEKNSQERRLHRSEDRLKALESQQKTILDAIPDLVWLKDREGRIITVNRAFENAVGMVRTTLVGKTNMEIFPLEKALKYQKDDDEVVSSGIAKTYEETRDLRNIGERQFATIKIPINQMDGTTIGTVSIARDISDMKNLENQLIRSEKLSAVGQLATGIAHEFNNILSIIKGTAELLRSGNRDNPSLIGELRIIDEETVRGADLVSRLLAFSRPKYPNQEICQISRVIESVLVMQKNQMALENVVVETDFPWDESSFIDKGQMEQVFLNLIINSRHAIKPKGSGKIRITESQDPEPGMMAINVSDDGIGMSDEIVKKLFTPFFTTKGAMAKDNLQINGTGLGLAICLTIIKSHKGDIRVKSRPGEGSTFSIILPRLNDLDRIVDSTQNRSDALPESGTKSLDWITETKFLIIDDERNITKMLKSFLVSLGAGSCRTANSGQDGLGLFREERSDIVLLDLLLPTMNGYEIFSKIREIDPEVQIVIISGQLGLEEENLKRTGASAFLKKPFNMDDLLETLERIRQ